MPPSQLLLPRVLLAQQGLYLRYGLCRCEVLVYVEVLEPRVLGKRSQQIESARVGDHVRREEQRLQSRGAVPQGLGEGGCALVADLIPAEPEQHQGRIGVVFERACQRDGARVSNAIRAQVDAEQLSVVPQRGGEGDRALVSELVLAQEQRVHAALVGRRDGARDAAGVWKWIKENSSFKKEIEARLEKMSATERDEL